MGTSAEHSLCLVLVVNCKLVSLLPSTAAFEEVQVLSFLEGFLQVMPTLTAAILTR